MAKNLALEVIMLFNFEELILNLHDGAYFVDHNMRIFFWNKSAEEITGYPAADVLGSRCSDNILIHVDERGEPLCGRNCPIAAPLRGHVKHEAELFLRHRDGHRVPVAVRVSPLRDLEGNSVGVVELFSDRSGKVAMESRLRELEALALLDPLTNLSNRRHLDGELECRVQEAQRYGLPSGVLFLDIDHFKNFNDDFGHDMGDRAIRTVANTLRSSARPFDVFGRWGGEEFVGILRNVEAEALKQIAARYRALIASSTVTTREGEQRITVSIGATLIRAEDTAESAIIRADALMYQSKQAGRNRVTSDC